MKYIAALIACLGIACAAPPVEPPTRDFDLALAEYAKSEYHRGCGDFDRTAALLDTYCSSVDNAVDSPACEFLDSTH